MAELPLRIVLELAHHELSTPSLSLAFSGPSRINELDLTIVAISWPSFVVFAATFCLPPSNFLLLLDCSCLTRFFDGQAEYSTTSVPSGIQRSRRHNKLKDMLTILRPGLPNEGEGRKLLSSLALPQFSSRTRTILTLIAVSGNTVLATFLNGALTVALPSIAKSIGMTQDLLSWPLAMFSLTSGALLLISGAMADAFGRRNVFLIGNVVFATICLIASFIKTAEPFIGCCAGLGVGAALLIPAGVGILGSSIPEGKLKNQSFALLGAAQPIGEFSKLRYGRSFPSVDWHLHFRIISSISPVGFIIGLILGGLLSTRWQVIFWILTGTTILFGACAILGLPRNGEELIQSRSPSSASLSSIARLNPTNAGSETGEQTPAAIGRLSAAGTSSATLPGLANMTGRAQANDTPTDRALRLKMFDWIGALMSTAGLVMLTFALADAETAPQGWQTPYVIALLPTSAFLLLAFLLWQRHLEKLQRIYELGASSTVGTRPGRNAHYLKAPPTTPLLPPAVWRAPKFGAVISVIFLAWLSFNVLSYLSTLVYQEVQQISAIKTSLLFLPMVGAGLVLNIFSGWAVGRVNAMWLVVFGASSGAAAALILSEGVDLHTPHYLGMLWVMILQVGPDGKYLSTQRQLSCDKSRLLTFSSSCLYLFSLLPSWQPLRMQVSRATAPSPCWVTF